MCSTTFSSNYYTAVPDTPATGESEAEPSSAPAAKPARKYDRSIVEGPLRAAIWKLAWPTMLTNVFGGLQVLIDHILVGHFLGYAGNAAIGVANQLIIMVISFIMSVFTGMSVLVARFVGAGDAIGADRAVYQAFVTALAAWWLRGSEKAMQHQLWRQSIMSSRSLQHASPLTACDPVRTKSRGSDSVPHKSKAAHDAFAGCVALRHPGVDFMRAAVLQTKQRLAHHIFAQPAPLPGGTRNDVRAW